MGSSVISLLVTEKTASGCFCPSDVSVSPCLGLYVQEVDLERLRDQWLVTLTQRQEYLDQQLQKIVSKPGTAGTLDLERAE